MHALLSRAPFLSLKSEAQPSCPPLPEPLLASSQGGASANRLSAETGIVPVWAGWEFLTLVSARLLGTAPLVSPHRLRVGFCLGGAWLLPQGSLTPLSL